MVNKYVLCIDMFFLHIYSIQLPPYMFLKTDSQTTRTPTLQAMNEMRRQAEEATRFLNMEINTNMRRSRVQSEAENLRSRAQSVSVMLETMPLENVNLRSVEKDLARQRKRVEEAEAILEDDRKSRLATEEARLRENSSKRRRLVETERRLPEDDEVSSIYENDLSGPFMRIGKILYRVNDPAVRDNPEYIRRNNIHLEKINEEEISRGLEKSLEARDQINQANMTEAFGKIIGHYKAEVLNIVDENLGDRMRRIEENEAHYLILMEQGDLSYDLTWFHLTVLEKRARIRQFCSKEPSFIHFSKVLEKGPFITEL